MPEEDAGFSVPELAVPAFSCLPEDAVLLLSVREAEPAGEAADAAGADTESAPSCGALADASCSPLLDAVASPVSSSNVISPLNSLSNSSSVRVTCVLSAEPSGRVSGEPATIPRTYSTTHRAAIASKTSSTHSTVPMIFRTLFFFILKSAARAECSSARAVFSL